MGEDTVDYYITGWGLLAVAIFGITGNKTLESSQFSVLRVTKLIFREHFVDHPTQAEILKIEPHLLQSDIVVRNL